MAALPGLDAGQRRHRLRQGRSVRVQPSVPRRPRAGDQRPRQDRDEDEPRRHLLDGRRDRVPRSGRSVGPDLRREAEGLMAAVRGTALLVTIAVLAATAAWAADDAVARAMQLYVKRHDRDAGRNMETALPWLDPGRR